MPRKINVLLLGTHAAVVSFFQRYRQEYHLLRQEDGLSSLSPADKPQQQPHLVVLLRDDLSLCYQASRTWPTLPLVVISENASERQMARALDLGADDYVTIPFGECALLARLRARLRRTHAPLPSDEMQSGTPVLTSQDGKIALHLAQHRCLLAGQTVHLTLTEFALLRVMMEHREHILSHRFLLQQVWGPAYGEECDYVRVYMRQLRRKIETDPSHPLYLLTEPGVGYVFHSPQA